jgi:two-component system NtrC family sensor kinase
VPPVDTERQTRFLAGEPFSRLLVVRLTIKLMTLFWVSTLLVLLASNAFRLQWDVRIFRADRAQSQKNVGRAIARAAASVVRSEGMAGAERMIARTNPHDDPLRVRWACVPSSMLGPSSFTTCAELDGLGVHDVRQGIGENPGYASRFFTYVPVIDGAERYGSIEVSEPTAIESRFVERALFDAMIKTIGMMLVAFLLTSMLGVWLVARPAAKLIAQARRIGLGDYTTASVHTSKDELGELAHEMNVMARRIEEATTRAGEEVRKRLDMLEQLRHADRLTTVGKLASGMAHELGTPLNVVEARASMIAGREVEGDMAVDSAKAILQATERMTKIVSALLAFARRRTLEKSANDLRVVANKSIHLVGPLAAKRAVSINAPGEEALKTVVEIDSMELEQAITNLLVNAIHATSPGGHVNVIIEGPNDRPTLDPRIGRRRVACLSIEDNGHGIAPEHLPNIFDPFFTTKDVGEGTGLGLSIAYGIVNEHGGWIEVDSRVGHGTRFNIFLPEAQT